IRAYGCCRPTDCPMAGSAKTTPFGLACSRPKATGFFSPTPMPSTNRIPRRARCKSLSSTELPWSLFLRSRSPKTGTRKRLSLIYLRLAKFFSYDHVNDPKSRVAAANGQFLMIRRDVYDAIGGHAGVAGEVLEDVAIALRVKAAGHRIWFGSGKGIVRVRMYRSFDAMWQGWKKNLYRLIGGTPWAVFRELESS